tara:strand:- start:247 stop:1173 length:927 start_codon:yes stop_codon:yes gene_type:complete
MPNLWHQKHYPVTIAVSKTPLSSPFYIAKAINAFDKTCVDVKYIAVNGGIAAFEKVMSGEVDFGTSSDSAIAFQSLTHQNFVTHTMFSQSDNDIKLITRSSDQIKSARDLKGKKVGVIKKSASEYLLSTLLAIEGLTIADVDLHYYTPELLLQSLRDLEVDAIIPWEPYAFQASKLLGNKITTHNTKNLSTLSFNLISLTPDNLLVEKAICIIKGLQIAINYIASHPQKSKKIVINQLNLDPSFIDWVWPDYIFKLGLNQSLILNLQSQASWAIDTHTTEYSAPPKSEKFIDTRALLRVEPGAVNLMH